jgi:hypothetical protein
MLDSALSVVGMLTSREFIALVARLEDVVTARCGNGESLSQVVTRAFLKSGVSNDAICVEPELTAFVNVPQKMPKDVMDLTKFADATVHIDADDKRKCGHLDKAHAMLDDICSRTIGTKEKVQRLLSQCSGDKGWKHALLLLEVQGHSNLRWPTHDGDKHPILVVFTRNGKTATFMDLQFGRKKHLSELLEKVLKPALQGTEYTFAGPAADMCPSSSLCPKWIRKDYGGFMHIADVPDSESREFVVQLLIQAINSD